MANSVDPDQTAPIVVEKLRDFSLQIMMHRYPLV